MSEGGRRGELGVSEKIGSNFFIHHYPTATWKTYTGKVFQYKYPNNLYLVDLNHNDSIDLFANKESADTSVTCFKNKLGTPQNPCPGSLMQVMITSANAQEAHQTASPSGSIKFSSSTNPQGVQMLKNEEAIGGMGRSIVFTAFVVKDPMIYTIAVQTTPQGYWRTLYPSDTKTDSEILNSESILLNQILSTFKFTTEQKPISQKRFGYIKSIVPGYDNYQITVDFANFIEDASAPNGYRIENPSMETINLQTDVPGSEPEIIMQTFSYNSDGNYKQPTTLRSGF